MEIVSSSGSFLSSFLIFLLLEKHTLASEQFSVIGPTEPIQAWVGRKADLPCYLSPQKNAQSMKVIWFQSLEIVHHYEDGQDKFDDQSPKFQGRTELVKDAITRGNVTLRIWNITAADQGHYKCHFDDGLYQEEAGFELFVSGVETAQQILWWIIVTVFFLVFWIPIFIGSLILLLPFREKFPQDLRWVLYWNGIITVASTFEISCAICHQWIMHRCEGYIYEENWKWMNLLIWMIFLSTSVRFVIQRCMPFT